MLLREFKADLHVHTCLSPCADWEMSPRKIIRRSREVQLDLIAVCDHNSAENAAAVMHEGRRNGVCVLPGLEICSREEVHVLALFGEPEQALAMQDLVYAQLSGENRVTPTRLPVNPKEISISRMPRMRIGLIEFGPLYRSNHASRRSK